MSAVIRPRKAPCSFCSCSRLVVRVTAPGGRYQYDVCRACARQIASDWAAASRAFSKTVKELDP